MRPPQPENATLAFRVDGLMEWKREVAGKIRHVVELAMQAISPERGPQDYDVRGEEMRALIGVLRDILREVSFHKPPGPGSVVQQSAKLGWLITLNIGITLAAVGWIASTLIEQGKELSVIKCQLNPLQCPQVPRGP